MIISENRLPLFRIMLSPMVRPFGTEVNEQASPGLRTALQHAGLPSHGRRNQADQFRIIERPRAGDGAGRQQIGMAEPGSHPDRRDARRRRGLNRSEEHTSELQSRY